ncbi:MAG: flagellar biosynthetic protein FliQ [Acidimicrobiales bacterium]
MTESQAITLLTQAMVLTAKTVGPILLASLVVGLVVAIFQGLTQVNDYTLSFAPKLAAVALVIIVTGHWLLSQLTHYTTTLYTMIPKILAGG